MESSGKMSGYEMRGWYTDGIYVGTKKYKIDTKGDAN